jgi:hypothetical protein
MSKGADEALFFFPRMRYESIPLWSGTAGVIIRWCCQTVSLEIVLRLTS